MQLSRALELAELLETEQPLASIHLRLGMAYRKLEQYPLSLEHLLQAEQLYLRKAQKEQHTYTQVNIAQTYLQMKDGDKAEAVLTEAMVSAEQQQNAHLVALVNYGLSQLAVLNEQLEKAKQLLHKALQYYSQLQNDSMRLELQLALAEVLLKLNDTAAAANQLPQLQELDQAADYLKNRYWGAEQAVVCRSSTMATSLSGWTASQRFATEPIEHAAKKYAGFAATKFKTTATATTTTRVTTAEPTMVDAIPAAGFITDRRFIAELAAASTSVTA